MDTPIKTNNDSIIYLDLTGDNGKLVAKEIINSLDEKKSKKSEA